MRSFISPTSGERRWKNLGGRLVCLGIAAFFLFGVGKTLYEDYGTRSWDNISATILSSKLERSKMSRRSHTYYLVIEYEYQMSNRGYRGTHNSLDVFSSEDGEKELARYPIGSPIIARVNQKNPSRSIVPENIPLVDYIFPGLIGLFFLWIATLRKKKKKKPSNAQPVSLSETPKGTIPPPILK